MIILIKYVYNFVKYDDQHIFIKGFLSKLFNNALVFLVPVVLFLLLSPNLYNSKLCNCFLKFL